MYSNFPILLKKKVFKLSKLTQNFSPKKYLSLKKYYRLDFFKVIFINIKIT